MGNWLDQNRAIVVGALALISAALGGFFFFTNRAEPPPLEIAAPEATPTPTAIVTQAPAPTFTPPATNTPQPLRVYISGEVTTPDVYILPPGSIIKDLLLAAGGATQKADLNVVNLAEELKDQQHIHIPAKKEARPTPPVSSGGKNPQPAVEVDTRSASPQIELQAGRKININTAKIAELELLPGIGPSFAKRIVEYREANGSFNAIEDITGVKGIGPATFEKLKDYITVN